MIEHVVDHVLARLRGSRPLRIGPACVLTTLEASPERYNPRGYDMPAVVPGLELSRLPTAHGREWSSWSAGSSAPIEDRVRVTLLVPVRAVSPRGDRPGSVRVVWVSMPTPTSWPRPRPLPAKRLTCAPAHGLVAGSV